MKFKKVNYKEYLKYASKDEIEKINEIDSNIFLSSENINKIKAIKDKVNIIVFSEPYCPDCAISTTIINKLSQENPNINICYYSREGNEKMLSMYTGETKIPSIICGEKCYIEFPQKIKPINEDDIYKFRLGKYNKYVIDELIDLLIE